MTLTCLGCGEIVAGVEHHVLPRGREQPIPYIFHQKCFQDFIDATEGELNEVF